MSANHALTLAAIEDRSARVVVIGQGYVGLPLALRAAAVGFTVVGFDTDGARIASLAAGHSYVGDVSDHELSAALGAGRYTPSSDEQSIAGFDVAIITVPTPLLDGKPDLSFIEIASRMLAERVRPGCCVVLESTTYPGTTSELVAPIIERACGLRAGADYHLGYSPERVDPGNKLWTLENTPKVVSGIDDASLDVVDSFYSALVTTTVRVGGCAEAEMTKLLENTFRHVNIALVNELAVFADRLGVDIWSVIDAASTKPFGFMRFTPGPGVGGHCLPVDPSYLAWRIEAETGSPFRFVELANRVNESMPAHVVERAQRLLGPAPLDGADVLLLGLSFKRGTSDCRESPSVDVARLLLDTGARVTAVDPYVSPLNLPRDLPIALVPLGADRLRAADLVILLVDHPEFEPQLLAENSRLLLDTKGVLRGRDFAGETL